ncbi:hypothetical protein [Athalassotoga sp.]|uniref:hypothetical protein n=1 Tax=Athalassotoga sp. TaxID=2022597 RepID=UPI003CFF96CE
MKKHTARLILAFELIPLALILSSCFLTKFNISTLRSFVPAGYAVKFYEIKVKPDQFIGYKSSKILRTVSVTYASTGSTVYLNAAEFDSSFDMHDLWYTFAKSKTGTWNALNSSLWWFSGTLKTSKYLAWYSNYTIFVLESSGNADLESVKKQVENFMNVFGSVKN